MLARDDLIHRMTYGFQPLELLNLANLGRLIHFDQRAPSAQTVN